MGKNRLPDLTDGEKQFYSKQYSPETQELADIDRLCETAIATGDSATLEAAIARFFDLTGQIVTTAEQLEQAISRTYR